MQKPRITEIQVRMDCNGCVQKIKKAINGIDGVYDIYIDLPQQKLTVIGRADPERIIKAIKKVRKVATICSHTEVPDQNSQLPETPADGGAPGPEGGNPTSEEPPKSEEPPPPPQEPPKDQPPEPPENPPAQNPPPETNPPLPATDNQPSQRENHSKPQDRDDAHAIYHHPPDYGNRNGYGIGYAPGYSPRGYGGQWSSQPGPSFRHEPPVQSEYQEPYQPAYKERLQPIYYEPPPPRPLYHEPPPRHVYHEPTARPIYHEPPPRPRYHEPPPQTSYHEPPPGPSYHEPPPQPGYHESPTRHRYHEPLSQPVYHEPPPRPGYQERPSQSPPVQVIHSYNTSRPSPYITAYQYVQSPPPPPRYTSYCQMDQYSTDPYWDSGASYGNDSSMFSDENPNACTIV